MKEQKTDYSEIVFWICMTIIIVTQIIVNAK